MASAAEHFTMGERLLTRAEAVPNAEIKAALSLQARAEFDCARFILKYWELMEG